MIACPTFFSPYKMRNQKKGKRKKKSGDHVIALLSQAATCRRQRSSRKLWEKGVRDSCKGYHSLRTWLSEELFNQ